ncbi:MAG: MerR family transcriptional regulator [Fusicatenibacter sp.]
MKTISQVAELSGISIRTLQYYDEIELLKPSERTESGYRLYNEEALQKLQQILFFRELGFRLNEITEILQQPDFDRIAAFRKQKKLLLLKRNRIEGLIRLLDRLEKGEECMTFKEFDLSDYIQALEDFKNRDTDEVIRHWGSIDNFDLLIQKVREGEAEIAKLAIQQFGSIENYTEAMNYNLKHFSEIMEKQLAQIPQEMKENDLFLKLASQKEEDAASGNIQAIVREIIAFAHGNAPSDLVGDYDHYCSLIIDTYSNDYLKTVFNTKYGTGSSEFIVNAFQCYLAENRSI